MINLEVNQQLPVINSNFDKVKVSLIESIEKYKGLVVSEETLKTSKLDQKELASARIKIDNYRKEIKQELIKPITEFEDKCKELITLVTEVEIPLKAGIEVFNQKLRDKKRTLAEETIHKAVTEYQLSVKYSSQLTVLDKYTILSTKAKDTKTDIDQRAFILLQEQLREIEALKVEEERKVEALRLETERKAELIALEEKRQIELATAEKKRKAENLEIAKDTLKEANLNIKNKMAIEDFQSLIESGISSMNIIQEIKKRMRRIIIQETPVVVPVIEPVIEVIETVKEEPIELPFTELEPADVLPVQAKRYFIEMRTEGTIEEITSLSKFLKDNNYNYDVIDKGVL